MALSYYALKNAKIGAHTYAVGDLVAEADVNGRGPYLVKRGLVIADGSSGGGGGGGGGLVHVATSSAFIANGWDSNSADGTLIQNCFSSTYDVYRVLIEGSCPVTEPGYMCRVIMTNGGTDPVHTNDYYGFTQGIFSNSLAANGPLFNADEQSYKWVPGHVGVGFAITMDIWNPANTRGKRFVSQAHHHLWSVDWATDGEEHLETGAGFNNSSSTYDGLLVMTSAVLSTMTVSVYGYAKA